MPYVEPKADRVQQSDSELHVGLDIPLHTARHIHNWARNQEWPEGTQLEEPREYHITLLYSPEGHEQHGDDPWWIKSIDKAECTVGGFTCFGPSDKGYAYVLLIDSPEIQEAGQQTQDQAARLGLPITQFPGGYRPHITVGYGPSKCQQKAPDFGFDVGPSSVSPPRKEASAPPRPPGFEEGGGTATTRCGTCKMLFEGRCWGYGNRPVESYDVCDSWAKETHRAAYEPGETEILDRLSLANVAHNLHYKFEQGGLDAHEVVAYAIRLLRLLDYPQDEITTQAAIQAWQQMYPQDRLLPEKIATTQEGLSQTIHQSEAPKPKDPDEVVEEDSTVPTEVQDPEDHWPEWGQTPPDKKRDVQFSNDLW